MPEEEKAATTAVTSTATTAETPATSTSTTAAPNAPSPPAAPASSLNAGTNSIISVSIGGSATDSSKPATATTSNSKASNGTSSSSITVNITIKDYGHITTDSEGLTWYFAYGSNMSSQTMKRRHIAPVQSLAGTLDKYRLAFDLGGSMRSIEPRFANMERDDTAVVHGVLHRITVEHLKQLVREEGGGSSYQRLELLCKSYDGQPILASAFILPVECEYRTTEAAPSARYLGLLIDGATEAGLDAAYIDKLKAITPAPLPVWDPTPATLAAIEQQAIPIATVQDSKGKHKYMAVKGIVFDISSDSTFFSNLFAYKDITLQIATFACCKELLEPKDVSQLTKKHKAYINAMCDMAAAQYPIVGHLQELPYKSFDF